MRIIVATVQVPFIHGGAEYLASGLKRACERSGHQAEIVTTPFRFLPISEVRRAMEIWENENFAQPNGYVVDRVICLKFPTYYLKHPNKTLWLAHQHRSVYDLWADKNSDGGAKDNEETALKKHILEKDDHYLSKLEKIFTISETVSARLRKYNGINSIPIYHPPPIADRAYLGDQLPYIFFPSRLEELKRQYLLIDAMRHVESPVIALIAGTGGQAQRLQAMISEFGLKSRIRLLGRISEEELIAYYANCFGVFFGPYEEDYGYVTIESMISSKPVIICHDSGGPLEFVVHEETGLIVEPKPKAIAEAIDKLYSNKKRSKEIGILGRQRYYDLNISWDSVVTSLLNEDDLSFSFDPTENKSNSEYIDKEEKFDYQKFPKKLNLGCGFDTLPGYLNVDLNEFHKPDLICDIRNLAMLPSEYYEEILAQDVLEHLPRSDTLPALQEWARLLMPGGIIKLRIPNLIGLLELFNREEKQSIRDQETLLQCLFGTQGYEGDWHFTGFTRILLEHYLSAAGFTSFEFKSKDYWLFDVTALKKN